MKLKLLTALTLSLILASCQTCTEDEGVVCPNKVQQEWAEAEIGILLHLDMFVYHPEYNHRKYGTHPDPMTFNSTELNTDQWIETAKNHE